MRPAHALAFALGLALAACKPAPQSDIHCFTLRGDATCEGIYGSERPYCVAIGCEGDDANYGCAPERPATDECYSPCGGEQTFLDDASCLGVADESTGSETMDESATGSTETTQGPCTSNAECPTDTPICDDSGACVGCTDANDPDAACTALDPNSPVCDQSSNTCVQCLPDAAAACTGDTPLCDEATSTCVGCAWHEQCQDACRMKTGACFEGAPLEAATPVELQQAIDDIAALDPPQGVVVLQDSALSGSVTVPAGVRVAILGADQAIPNWQGANGSPALTLEAGAEVYLQGVRIANTAGALGIVVSGELWLDRSMVVNNAGGGLLVDGGAAVVRNSFVGGNNTGVVAIDIDGGSADISFTTAYSALTLGTPAIALRCAPRDIVNVHNSILVTSDTDPEVVCSNATITSSVLEDGAAFPGNTELPFIETWFVAYTQGNYHLAPGMYPPAIDSAATWLPGDPIVDIDGDPRPQDDTPTAAGADLP